MGRARVDVMSACFFLVMAVARFKGSRPGTRVGLSKSLLTCGVLFACIAAFNAFPSIRADLVATTCFMMVQLISTCNVLKDTHIPYHYSFVVLSLVSIVLLLYAILDHDHGVFEPSVDVVDVV